MNTSKSIFLPGTHYASLLYRAAHSPHPCYPCYRHWDGQPLSRHTYGRARGKDKRLCHFDWWQPWRAAPELHNMFFDNFKGFRGQACPFSAASGQWPPLVYFHHHGTTENHHEAPNHHDGTKEIISRIDPQRLSEIGTFYDYVFLIFWWTTVCKGQC